MMENDTKRRVAELLGMTSAEVEDMGRIEHVTVTNAVAGPEPTAKDVMKAIREAKAALQAIDEEPVYAGMVGGKAYFLKGEAARMFREIRSPLMTRFRP